MINLTLDTKKCMAELLLRDTFHDFLFIEGEITTFNKFTIDGLIHKEFYGDMSDLDTEELATASSISYSRWEALREYCFSLIKGKRTPLDFKMIFSLSQEMIQKVIAEKEIDFQPEAVQGLYLNFRYDGTTLSCITGTSMKTFTLDKSLEKGFDQWVREFFAEKEIAWEEAE